MTFAEYLLKLDGFDFMVPNDPKRYHCSKRTGYFYQLTEIGNPSEYTWTSDDLHRQFARGRFYPVKIPQKKIERL